MSCIATSRTHCYMKVAVPSPVWKLLKCGTASLLDSGRSQGLVCASMRVVDAIRGDKAWEPIIGSGPNVIV